jgi:hypothetical protein
MQVSSANVDRIVEGWVGMLLSHSITCQLLDKS